MKDIKKLLGKRVKELRKQKGFSQEELSELANIDQRSISHIECGNVFPSRSLFEIALALGVGLEELFDFEHHELNLDEMKKYIAKSLDRLEQTDIKTLYRFVKSMR